MSIVLYSLFAYLLTAVISFGVAAIVSMVSKFLRNQSESEDSDNA